MFICGVPVPHTLRAPGPISDGLGGAPSDTPDPKAQAARQDLQISVHPVVFAQRRLAPSKNATVFRRGSSQADDTSPDDDATQRTVGRRGLPTSR